MLSNFFFNFFCFFHIRWINITIHFKFSKYFFSIIN